MAIIAQPISDRDVAPIGPSTAPWPAARRSIAPIADQPARRRRCATVEHDWPRVRSIRSRRQIDAGGRRRSRRPAIISDAAAAGARRPVSSPALRRDERPRPRRSAMKAAADPAWRRCRPSRRRDRSRRRRDIRAGRAVDERIGPRRADRALAAEQRRPRRGSATDQRRRPARDDRARGCRWRGIAVPRRPVGQAAEDQRGAIAEHR